MSGANAIAGMVSVIIPLYNRGKLAIETLHSVLNQSYKNFECIVVDDHSTDGVFEMVSEFAKVHPNFIVKSRSSSKKGACVCRNEGLEIFRGEFVMFLDSDDLLSPNCFEGRVKLMSTYPDANFIVHQIGIFNHSSYQVTDYYSSLKHENDLDAFVNVEGWQTSNTFFRSNFVRNYRFDEDALSWQDVDFHIRILLDNPSYKKFPESLPDVYMRHSGFERISNSNIKFERAESRLRLLNKLESLFEEKNIKSYQRPFLIFYFKFLEIAALLFSSREFELLLGIWRKSNTFYARDAKFYRAYLLLQHRLKKIHLSIVCSVLYRIIRLFLPLHLLYAKNRHVKLKQQIVVSRMVHS